MRIGVDLGGTKIEAVVLSGDGRELFRERVPTPKGDYEGTLKAIRALVERASDKLLLPGMSVGIGTPGVTSGATGLIKNSNSQCLIGKPLGSDFEKLLNRKVRLANDANCFTLSEASDGAATGASVVFGVILGTGVGGGLVVDGKVLNGANGITGEWGHNPLPWASGDELKFPKCYCGRTLCNELFLCGPSLAANYGGKTEGLYEDRLARGLASIINVIDPDVIVLGGGVSNVERLYDAIPKIWGKYIFSDTIHTKLVRAKHGDSSGVRGAAWLW